MRTALLLEDLTYAVIGCGIEVQKELGYGFTEVHYVMALERELLAKGTQSAESTRSWFTTRAKS